MRQWIVAPLVESSAKLLASIPLLIAKLSLEEKVKFKARDETAYIRKYQDLVSQVDETVADTEYSPWLDVE